jgi:hypothetical protein
MMSSDTPQDTAAEILQRIHASLQARPWSDIIDGVIHDVVAGLATGSYPSTSRQVIQHVAETLDQILVRLPEARNQLSPDHLLDEAAHLVGHGIGFDAALPSAVDRNTAGLEAVYLGLGEVLKERFRSAQVNWAFARHLDPTDWESRRAVAELLLSRLRGDMREDAPPLRPEMFVDCIPDLFFQVQEIENAPLSILLNRAFSTTHT